MIQTRINTREFVMPKDVFSIPIIHAHRIAFAPTDKSMPAVISTTSIAAEISPLTAVCLRIFIILLRVKNFSVASDKTMNKRTKASKGATFPNISFIFFVFIEFRLPKPLS